MKNLNEYKEIRELEKRKELSCKLGGRYNKKIPVICVIPKELIKDSKTNYKYMLSPGVNICNLVNTVKRRVKFIKKCGLFVFTENGYLLNDDKTIGFAVEDHIDEDGFLYLYFRIPFC